MGRASTAGRLGWIALLASFSALASLDACAPRAEGPADREITRSFYYWRTTFHLSAAERRALADLRVGRIYLRVFDVAPGEDGAPAPVSPVVFSEPLPSIEVVPVVFLREAAVRPLGPEGTRALAERIWSTVRARAQAGGLSSFRELELDCDWSEGSRVPYFEVLSELRTILRPAGVSLGATIRLHQVKYRERTGVPPVDRGMLMFYNMGRVDAAAGTSAIFDPEAAKKYLARVRDYPLPLDLALPIWSWVVHTRGDQVASLLQSTDPSELEAISWLRPAGPGRFEATETTFLHGTLLRRGDVLKTEATTATVTASAARLIAPELAPAAGRAVSLFDLSERNLERHDVQSLERLFRAFR